MVVVLGALLQAFMPIALGLLLRHVLLTEDAHRVGLECVVYHVLFPARLILTLARADLETVPTSSSAYVLARQIGGDAPLLAQIITLHTALAAPTMPVAIALVQ